MLLTTLLLQAALGQTDVRLQSRLPPFHLVFFFSSVPPSNQEPWVSGGSEETRRVGSLGR